MTEQERRRAALLASIKLLGTHEPFLEFMGALEEMREAAIRDACHMDVVKDHGRIASVMGAVGAYTDIQDLVKEAQASRDQVDTSA